MVIVPRHKTVATTQPFVPKFPSLVDVHNTFVPKFSSITNRDDPFVPKFSPAAYLFCFRSGQIG